MFCIKNNYFNVCESAVSKTVIVLGNEIRDLNSKPGQGCSHFTSLKCP